MTEKIDRAAPSSQTSVAPLRRVRVRQRPWWRRPTELFVAGFALVAVLGAVVAGFGLATMPAASQGFASFETAPTVTAPFSSEPSAVPTQRGFPVDVGPSRVVIPSAGIDQPLKNIDADPANILYPPTDAAGWYVKSAALLSAVGSTTLAGHINTDSGGPGPFAGLARVKAGDPITVTTAGGDRTDWRVVSSQNYPKDDVPAQYYDPQWPTRQLVAITCGGPVTGTVPGTNLPTFDMNTVVVAIPASDAPTDSTPSIPAPQGGSS